MNNKKIVLKTLKKLISITLFIIIALSFSFIIEAKANNNDVDKITISVPVGPSSIPAFYMQENSNYDVKASIHKNKNIAISRLMDGTTDMSLLPTNEAVKLYNKDIDIKITNIHTWGLFYIISSDSNLSSWKDLKEKEIYVPEKGGPMDIVFSYLAERKNIDLNNEFNIKRGKPNQISQLLINNMTDIAVLREPFVSQVLLKNSEAQVMIDLQKEWKKEMSMEIPQAALVVRNDFAKENPQIIKQFNEEYKEAINWMNNNNSKAAEIASKHMNIKNEVTKSSTPRLNLQYEKAIDVQEEINNYLELLKSYNPKTFGDKIPNEEFYFQY
ncbi:MAG: ABC transporter substrate-binding protein [Bacillota bacterium]